MPARCSFPLPRGWSKRTRSAVLHAISIASTAMTTAWAKSRARQTAEADRLRTELALLREELEIKDARWERAPARRRPHYGPVQRMRILKLRAARGWSVEQTAKRFLVTEDTITAWMRRLDEGGERALVQTEEPVNKFPELVAHLVRYLKLMCPALGKVRIAQVLTRAGMHISASTVKRMIERPPRRDDESAVTAPRRDGVTARHPNHVWHVDLTTVPIGGGFWVPWLPFARPQRWPFCWWVAVAIDQASRRLMGVAAFKDRPNSKMVCAFLERSAAKAGGAPKHIVTDKGKEFDCSVFREWCRGQRIRPRFGAVGEHGSISVVERVIRSIKSECTRRILVPLRLDSMQRELRSYATWYNEHRPHQELGGQTPGEVHRGDRPASLQPRYEPRPSWPRKARCARPNVPVEGATGAKLLLALKRVDGRSHLPIVELKRVA